MTGQVAVKVIGAAIRELREHKGLTLEALTRFLTDALGERPFRAAQLYRWIHQRLVDDFDQMTDLSKALRSKLKERAVLGTDAAGPPP